MSSFLAAAINGKLKYIKQQLNAGYKPDKDKDANGNTALLISSKNGFVDVVSALITAGANLNATNNLGETSLILASKNGHTAVVLLLIQSRVNLNVQADNRDTALISAVRNNKLDIANLLIDNGANIDIEGLNSNNAMDIAMAFEETSDGYRNLVGKIQGIYDARVGAKFDELGPALTARINLGENNCAICLDKYTDTENGNLVILNCGHIFHINCFRRWRNKPNNPCPTCRAPITNIRSLTIDSTPGETYTGQYFLGGSYEDKLQKYLNKLSNNQIYNSSF